MGWTTPDPDRTAAAVGRAREERARLRAEAPEWKVGGGYRTGEEQAAMYAALTGAQRVEIWRASNHMTAGLRITALGHERLAEAARAAPALEALAHSMRFMPAEAAGARSEAAVRQFRRRPRWRMLWLAMRWAFVAEWRRATA